ncbi:hypothetical protein [Microbulbifer halophilus]|uniref:Tetratricopeptide repeat protein n=1 Tax=Microbulbifer halophilus TaxID=453963 RepID=A0ABW5EIC2_9GAMM|nr:hypothetical protein [Microbulbifer halophilus]MCW8128314.1 hypothetical protein [Microbulbifer halophilus]
MDLVAKEGFEDTCVDLMMWAMGRELTKTMSFDEAKSNCRMVLEINPSQAIDVIVEALTLNERRSEVQKFLSKANKFELIDGSEVEYFLKKDYIMTNDHSVQESVSGGMSIFFWMVIILAVIGLFSLF